MRKLTRRQRGLGMVILALAVTMLLVVTGLAAIRPGGILAVLGCMVVAIFGLMVMRGSLTRSIPFRDVIERSLRGEEGKGSISLSLAASLVGLFFLSGFSALLYQVAWQRLLGLFAGSDIRSITLVTGAYLGGLGVGGLIGAQVADRLDSQRAVRLYAIFNLGIAAFAFLSRLIFYDLLFLGLGGLSTSTPLMFVVVFASLLIPTTLMGLSLPLLSRALVRNVGGAAGIIAVLNGVNIFGASMGALIGGLVLVGTLGFDRTVYVGGALSVLVGLMGLRMSRGFASGDHDAADHPTGPAPLRSIPRVVWIWCGLVFISGFMSISLELIWFRILDVTLHSNAYTFSYLLFIFLLCDGLGNLIGARSVETTPDPRRSFLWIQGIIALYALASVFLLLAIAQVQPLWSYFNRPTNEGSFLTFAGGVTDSLTTLVYLGFPALLMIVPALLIGLTFPYMQRAVQTDVHVVGQRVSLLDVANIAGNTTASFVTGLILLNFLGSDGTLRVMGAIGLIFLAAYAWTGLKQVSLGRRAVLASTGIALIALMIILPNGTAFWSNFHAQGQDNQFYTSEDSSGVSAIVGDRTQVGVVINGRPQGDIPFSSAHVTMGLYPAMIHPDPRRVLIVGVGTGGTAYSGGVRAETRDISVVEIIGSDLQVLQTYADSTNNVALKSIFTDPRYHIIVGDGRHVLLAPGEFYDLIQADPVQPVASGSGFLYSREYFLQAQKRLARGGVMAEWRPTARVEATFKEVFPYGFVVGGFLLIGSNEPFTFDRAAVTARFDDPDVIAYFHRAGIDVQTFKAALEAQPINSWDKTTPSSDINTDLWPRDEYFLNNPYEGVNAPH